MVRRKFSEDDVQQIVERYRAGEGRATIAASFGSKHETITRILRGKGIETRDDRTLTLSEEQERAVVERYTGGESLKSICQGSGWSSDTLYKILRKHHVTRRPHGGQARRFTVEEIAQIADMANAGASQHAIGRALNTSQEAISHLMAEHGITPSWAGAARGDRHGHWKGGRSRNNSGYWQVRVASDSPFASMRGGSLYVMEHRLVMAEQIGRPLFDHETVHHINGDREDNRPTNLQLRIGKHGKGAAFRCRACGSVDVEAVPLEDVT